MWHTRIFDRTKCIIFGSVVILCTVKVDCRRLDSHSLTPKPPIPSHTPDISEPRGPAIGCPTLLAATEFELLEFFIRGCSSSNLQLDDVEELIDEASAPRSKRSKIKSKIKPPSGGGSPPDRTIHRPAAKPTKTTTEHTTRKTTTHKIIVAPSTRKPTTGHTIRAPTTHRTKLNTTSVERRVNKTSKNTTLEVSKPSTHRNSTIGKHFNNTSTGTTTTERNIRSTNYPKLNTTSIEHPVNKSSKNATLGVKKPSTDRNSTTVRPFNNTSTGIPSTKLNSTSTRPLTSHDANNRTLGSGNNSTNIKNANHTLPAKPVPSAPPEERKTETKPLGNEAKTGTPPPIGFNYTTTPPGAPFPLSVPPYKPTPRGSYKNETTRNPAGYGDPPPPGIHQQHQTGGVTINNIITNNYIERDDEPTYSYSRKDVGAGTLGFFLGYSLGKMKRPSYRYHPAHYDGYRPRYDHYEVHHYYHNADVVPKESSIQPVAILGCPGDSGTICPSGTTSLCLTNGAILCVANVASTVRCANGAQGSCVNSVVPCVDGSVDCKVGTRKTMAIPCISTAKVPGSVTYVNNTIIVNQTTIINNYVTNNSTTGNSTFTSVNSTTLSSSSVTHNGNVPLSNLTNSTLSNLGNLINGTTLEGSKSKTEMPLEYVNKFCVTVVALPAKRKRTQKEELVKIGTSIFSKFLVRALGA